MASYKTDLTVMRSYQTDKNSLLSNKNKWQNLPYTSQWEGDVKAVQSHNGQRYYYERLYRTPMNYRITYLPCAFQRGNTSWADSSDIGCVCLCRWCSCVESDTCTCGSCAQNDGRIPCNRRTTRRRSVYR